MFGIHTAIACLIFLRPNSFLTVKVHPTDRESRSDLSICASSLPKDKVIFLMPEEEEVEEEDHEEDHRIPEPRAAVTGGVEPKKVEQYCCKIVKFLNSFQLKKKSVAAIRICL